MTSVKKGALSNIAASQVRLTAHSSQLTAHTQVGQYYSSTSRPSMIHIAPLRENTSGIYYEGPPSRSAGRSRAELIILPASPHYLNHPLRGGYMQHFYRKRLFRCSVGLAKLHVSVCGSTGVLRLAFRTLNLYLQPPVPSQFSGSMSALSVIFSPFDLLSQRFLVIFQILAPESRPQMVRGGGAAAPRLQSQRPSFGRCLHGAFPDACKRLF